MPNVDPVTKQAVTELADQLGYKPNLKVARHIKKRSYNIGVIIPSFTIYFYSEALAGIHDGAISKGYNTMICQTNESYEQEKKCVELLASSRIEALVLSISRETKDFSHIQKVLDRGIPVVLFNRICDIKASKVTVNDYEGAFKATEHLILGGAKRIAHIAGPDQLQISKNRLRGYLDAMKKHRMKVDDKLVVSSDFTTNHGADLARDLMNISPPPDAIFAVCDAVAYGVLEIARDMNIEVPKQLKIVGFTDEPHSSRLRPQLSSVKQPIFEIGETAINLAIEAIENPDADPKHEILNTQLNVRASTTG